MAYDEKTGQMKPSPTAPAGAKTAGPNGSFRVDDKKHARLALSAAPRSEKLGHITPGEEAHIETVAHGVLGKSKRGMRQQPPRWKQGRG